MQCGEVMWQSCTVAGTNTLYSAQHSINLVVKQHSIQSVFLFLSITSSSIKQTSVCVVVLTQISWPVSMHSEQTNTIVCRALRSRVSHRFHLTPLLIWEGQTDRGDISNAFYQVWFLGVGKGSISKVHQTPLLFYAGLASSSGSKCTRTHFSISIWQIMSVCGCLLYVPGRALWASVLQYWQVCAVPYCSSHCADWRVNKLAPGSFCLLSSRNTQRVQQA